MQLKQFLTKPLSELTYIKPSPYDNYISSTRHTFPNIPTSSIYVPPYIENQTHQQPKQTPETIFQNIMNNATPSTYNIDLRTTWKDNSFAELLEQNYKYVKTNYYIDMHNSKILNTFNIELQMYGERGTIILHENNIAEVVQYGSGRPYVDHMIISVKCDNN